MRLIGGRAPIELLAPPLAAASGGLTPASILATISHRDSHDNRFRRGRSITCNTTGLLSSFGSSTTRRLEEGPDGSDPSHRSVVVTPSYATIPGGIQELREELENDLADSD